jgi:hypothetical protein
MKTAIGRGCICVVPSCGSVAAIRSGARVNLEYGSNVVPGGQIRGRESSAIARRVNRRQVVGVCLTRLPLGIPGRRRYRGEHAEHAAAYLLSQQHQVRVPGDPQLRHGVEDLQHRFRIPLG